MKLILMRKGTKTNPFEVVYFYDNGAILLETPNLNDFYSHYYSVYKNELADGYLVANNVSRYTALEIANNIADYSTDTWGPHDTWGWE